MRGSGSPPLDCYKDVYVRGWDDYLAKTFFAAPEDRLAQRADQLRPELWLTPLLLFYVAWTVANPDLGGAGDEGAYF
jgi:hypothetical protein